MAVETEKWPLITGHQPLFAALYKALDEKRICIIIFNIK